ncbi:hypothetical protein ACVWZ8_005105 [Arthrobacter sp. UYCu723]
MRDAAAEFEWARDLYRSTGHRDHLARACQQALDRACWQAPSPDRPTRGGSSNGGRRTAILSCDLTAILNEQSQAKTPLRKTYPVSCPVMGPYTGHHSHG